VERWRIGAPLAVTALAAAIVSVGVIGADSRWMVPLGGLVADGRLPGSLPFASAPTQGWHDVPALSELVSWLAYSSFGDRGLVFLQLLAVTCGWTMLARGLLRQGNSEGGRAVVALLVLVGCVAQLAVTRSYLFSLALFPVLLYLIEADSRRPSRRIWLALPLLALWSNLHGVALVGWVVLLIYLAFARLRSDPRTAVLVGVGSTLALCITPVSWNTPSFYFTALNNESARRGYGLWAPLHASGLAFALIGSALVLLALAVRGRPLIWEWVCIIALSLGTIRAEEVGPWLLFLLAYPAARGLHVRRPPRAIAVIMVGLFSGVALVGLWQNPLAAGSPTLAREAAAQGLPVLADGLVVEQVEADGGRVWVGNPLDAFRRSDQRLYLDWLAGMPGGEQAVSHAKLVIVKTATAQGRAAARDPRLERLRLEKGYALYRVG
jgi:hypothetical protein